MRKIDLHKVNSKAAKCVNFDWIVLKKLEERCKDEGTKVSTFVNEVMRRTVMDDSEFYKYMMKHHCAMMNHYKTMGGI